MADLVLQEYKVGKRKKKSFVKEILLSFAGFLLIWSSKIIALTFTKKAAALELQRLNGEVSLEVSGFLIEHHQQASDLILVLGISLIIVSIGMILLKRSKR